MYAEAISGAQRLPNGNTIIDDGTHGTFIEVTAAKEVVWKYICPVVATGPLQQGQAIPDDPARAGEKMNAVFRVYKYPPTYAAFTGKTLTPGSYVETYPTAVKESEAVPSGFQLLQNYPNPFNPSTVIRYRTLAEGQVTLSVFDVTGRCIKTLVKQFMTQGEHEVTFDATGLADGVYFYRLDAGAFSAVKKMSLVR
jgi:hypothetical protein